MANSDGDPTREHGPRGAARGGEPSQHPHNEPTQQIAAGGAHGGTATGDEPPAGNGPQAWEQQGWAPTLSYPTTESYDPYPASAYPEHQPSPGAQPEYQPYPEQGRGAYVPTAAYPTAFGGGPAYGGPPPGPGSTGPLPTQPPEERRRRNFTLGTLVLVSVGVLIVGLVIGYLIGVSQTGPSTSDTASSAGQSPDLVLPPQGQGGQPGQGGGGVLPAPDPGQGGAAQPGPGQTPGDSGGGVLGGGPQLGGAVGTISSISGDGFMLRGLDGSTTTVKTTPNTKVATIFGGANNVSSLVAGDAVVVKGQTAPDGTITADLVIAGSLKNLGGN